MDDLLVERILRAVEQIPPGSVASYGDVAAVVGTSARQVGKVMAQWGNSVAWWRVVRTDGSLPAKLADDARQHWIAEGIKFHGEAVQMREHRANLEVLATAYAAVTHDL